MPAKRRHIPPPDTGRLSRLGEIAAGSPTSALPQPDAAGQFAAADAAGVIRVWADPAGTVLRVAVHDDWRRALPPEGFGPALFAAYRMAVGGAIAGAPGGNPPGHYFTPPAPAGEEPGEWAARTHARLDSVRDRLRKLREQGATGLEEITISGRSGLLSARVRVGVVLAVDGDPDAIRRARPDQLEREALTLLRAAQGRDIDLDQAPEPHDWN